MEAKAAAEDILAELIDTCLTNIRASSQVLDFSSTFKKKKKVKRLPKDPQKDLQDKPEPLENIETLDIELAEVIEIPDKLMNSPEEMQERKFLDLRRWYCMSRPQYSKSCGITSLVSCWNYLYSVLGWGKLPVLSQEKALITLGIEPPFHNIKFGPFTGNNTLINWFLSLNLSFSIKGRARIFWKLHGKNRTEGKSKDEALKELVEGLKSSKKAYIYHCFNHYMCPIGFELAPLIPCDAYKPLKDIKESEVQAFIIVGEASKAYPIFHIRKWDDIALDIDQQNPNYYNIRKPEMGIQVRTSEAFVSGNKLGKNLHCIIEFESLE